MGSPPLPPKKEVALALLANSSVFVHLDPRGAGVVVPPWFKRQPQLVLQIGLNMPVPIPDLHLDDAGMSCTLSFNRAPFHCMVPWTSVYAMVDDEGSAMVWPDEVPPEVQAQARAKMAERALEGSASPPAPEPAHRDGVREGGKRPRLEEVRSEGAPPPKGRGKGDGRGKAEGRGTGPVAPVRPLAERADRERAPAPRSDRAAARGDRSRGEKSQIADGRAPSGSTSGERTPAPRGTPERAHPARPPQRPAQPGAKKPKRELPPYLRVVK